MKPMDFPIYSLEKLCRRWDCDVGHIRLLEITGALSISSIVCGGGVLEAVTEEDVARVEKQNKSGIRADKLRTLHSIIGLLVHVAYRPGERGRYSVASEMLADAEADNFPLGVQLDAVVGALIEAESAASDGEWTLFSEDRQAQAELRKAS